MARKDATTTALTFDDDELDVVIAGLTSLSRYADEDGALADGAEALLERIAAVLPDIPGSPAKKASKGDSPHLGAICEAIRTETKLVLSYVDRKQAESRRTIWPIELGHAGAGETVAAWCESRRDFRHFRLDRIVAAEGKGERYPGRRRILLARLRLAEIEQSDY